MRNQKIFVFLVLFLASGVCDAREGSGVSVDQLVFCREVRERNPLEVDTQFPDTVGRVFCHTRISADQPPTHISHVWYYQDVQMAVVDLAVNDSPWRTWSSKCIVPEWTGLWRVDVISEDGVVIRSEQFFITPAPN